MDTSRDAKTVVIKTLAIVGFFATAGLIIWLIVQGIRFAPAAFTSLASIVEGLDAYRKTPELSLATEKSIINSGESMSLSWTDVSKPGTFEFGYACTEGISLDVRGARGELVTIPCQETLSLPSDVHGLFVSIHSEKSRFTDVPLSVAFIGNDGNILADTITNVTVVNATIPVAVLEPKNETQPVQEEKPTVPKVSEPAAVVKAPEPEQPKPVRTDTVASYIPVSIPTGTVDLKTSFLGVGKMDGNTFVPTAAYDAASRNSFRFEVRNIGTKTSDTWDFEATLPGGITYKADPQTALLPNERVVFTLGFTMNTDANEKYAKIGVTVSDKSDVNKANDSFTWAVEIKD